MMSTNLMIVIGLGVAALAGAASAGLVFIDLSHRRVTGSSKLLWLLLAFLLPGLGMGIYFLIRILNHVGGPADAGDAPIWVTRARRPARDSAAGYTIPAADLLRPKAPAAPPAPPPVQLRVLSGPDQGRAFPIGRLPALIGRGADVAVPLDGDITVSRRHAEIYAPQGALRIRDLGSSHGTQVNGFSIQDKSLEMGDRIQVGKTLLQVES